MKIATTYSEKQTKLAVLAKALGHPARIAILDYLIGKKSCVCGEIVNELPLAQATVSQHLKELKNVGLIKGEIEGTKVCYCINNETWNTLMSFFSDFVDTAINCNDDQCC